MAFKPGTVSYFNLDNASGTPTNLSPYIDDVSYPQTVQMLDVSTFGTGAKAMIPGLTDGDTIAVKGPYDATVWTHLTNVKAAQIGGTASFTFLWGPGGSVSGQAKATGECLLAGVTVSAGIGGRVEWSAQLQVTGAVTNGVF